MELKPAVYSWWAGYAFKYISKVMECYWCMLVHALHVQLYHPYIVMYTIYEVSIILLKKELSENVLVV